VSAARRWFSPPAQLGATGLYLFALAAFSSRFFAVVGCLLMLAAAWQQRSSLWPRLRRLSVVWLLLLFCAYVVLRAVVAVAQAPEFGVLHAKDMFRVLYLAGVLLVACYLLGDQARMLRMFSLAAGGFVIARLWYFDWSFSGPQPWWQQRMGLGLEQIGFGFYAATLVLALLIFAPRLLGRWQGAGPRSLAALGWLLLTGLALQGVVLSQSRMAWFSLALLALLVLAVGIRHFPRWPLPQQGVVLFSILLLAGVAVLNGPTLLDRLSTETGTYARLAAGELEEITSGEHPGAINSVGTRVVMLRTGYQLWQRGPLFGLGPAAPKVALQQSSDPILPLYNDYHNVPLELLIRFGAVGLLLASAVVALILWHGWQAWRRGQLAGDVALFLACGMLLILFSCLTNFRLLNYDWRYWMFLFAGALLSPALATVGSGPGKRPEGPAQ
jgi:O-antigen ligase